jgi:hypothetical protein
VKFKQIYENYKVKLKIKPKSTLSVSFQEDKFIRLNNKKGKTFYHKEISTKPIMAKVVYNNK